MTPPTPLGDPLSPVPGHARAVPPPPAGSVGAAEYTVKCEGTYDWKKNHDLSTDQAAALLSILDLPEKDFSFSGQPCTMEVTVSGLCLAVAKRLLVEVDSDALCLVLTDTDQDSSSSSSSSSGGVRFAPPERTASCLRISLPCMPSTEDGTQKAKLRKSKNKENNAKLIITLLVDNTPVIKLAESRTKQQQHDLELQRQVQGELDIIEKAKKEKKRQEEELAQVQAEEDRKRDESRMAAIEEWKKGEEMRWKEVEADKAAEDMGKEIIRRREELAKQQKEKMLAEIENTKPQKQQQVTQKPAAEVKEEDFSHYVGNAPQKIKQLLGIDFCNHYLFALDY
eukprot:TRINITY_DN66112_c9_g5_i1.p1 TRINITY_DN66112_c9_g5~~TRINITY_DN66112_c9_g5_i1.p1  ORF type:complete len:339 (-),score=54.39 TRINITY_DN66112_c9_g5_i1:674-1690(-)